MQLVIVITELDWTEHDEAADDDYGDQSEIDWLEHDSQTQESQTRRNMTQPVTINIQKHRISFVSDSIEFSVESNKSVGNNASEVQFI